MDSLFCSDDVCHWELPLAVISPTVLLFGSLLIFASQRNLRSSKLPDPSTEPLLGDEEIQDDPATALSNLENHIRDAQSASFTANVSFGAVFLFVITSTYLFWDIPVSHNKSQVSVWWSLYQSVSLGSWLAVFTLQYFLARRASRYTTLMSELRQRDPTSGEWTIIGSASTAENFAPNPFTSAWTTLIAIFVTFVSLEKLWILKEIFASGGMMEFVFAVVSLQIWLCIILFAISVGGKFAGGSKIRFDAANSEDKRPIIAAPEPTTSWYSFLTYSYMNPLYRIGTKRVLVEDDVFDLPDRDRTDPVYQNYLRVRAANPSRPLYQILALSVYPTLVRQYLSSITVGFLSVVNPFLLKKILQWIQCPASSPKEVAWMYLCGILLASLMRAIFEGQGLFNGRRAGNNIRSILVAELYSKSLSRVPDVGTGPQPQQSSKPGEEVKVEGAKPAEQDSSKTAATLGKIVNLMSTDTEQIRILVAYSHNLLFIPISITLCLTSLFWVIGPSALAGVLVMMTAIPITSSFSSWIRGLSKELLAATDKRVTLTNEIFQGIRIVKYFAWELSFTKKIVGLRNKELDNLWRRFKSYIVFNNVTNLQGILVTVVTFASYTLIAGGELDPATAFTALALLQQIQPLLSQFPHYITMTVQARVSLDRIDEFLQQPDLEKYKEDVDIESKPVEELPVGFARASFTHYGSAAAAALESDSQAGGSETDGTTVSADTVVSTSPGSSSFTLKELTVDFKLGALTVVTGPTGSGKSSMITALFGEMKRLAGTTFLPDPRILVHDKTTLPHDNPQKFQRSRVAYVPQTAWLMNATIRDNICFGLPFDPVRYTRVIRACALVKDFENFESGDETEIGEKGINLSGGQKQRISLARAAYSNAEYVLLDDPLSAVDAPTARHLYKRCIIGLMAGRTRILVTHAIGLVFSNQANINGSPAEWVVVVQNGQVATQGTIADVAASDVGKELFTGILSSNEKDEDDLGTGTESAEGEAEDFSAGKAVKKLVKDEEKAKGAVSLTVYMSYFAAVGGWRLAFYVFGFVLVQTSRIARTWWIQKWSEGSKPVCSATSFTATTSSMMMGDLPVDVFSGPWTSSVAAFTSSVASNVTKVLVSDAQIQVATTTNAPSRTVMFLGVYFWLGVAMMVCQTMNSVIMIWLSFRASKFYHLRLLESALGAPLRFFETTPIGRILNRFSRDLQRIDTEVAQLLLMFFETGMMVLSILVGVAFILPPYILVIPLLLLAFLHVSQTFVPVSRELQRFESVTRSPVYSLFSETLNGVTTVRAYGQEARFRKMASEKVDTNHRFMHYLWVGNRWLAFRTDLLSAFAVFFTGVFVVWASGPGGTITAGWAGFALVWVMELASILWILVRAQAEAEMGMNSVERVDEYCKLPQEPPAIVDNYRPTGDWPTEGKIEVTDLSVRYAPNTPLVLKNLNVSLRAHEKVGIVGRTGAGKSTLSLAFFRIIPFDQGTIHIDGLDISKLGLRDLRSRLTIIPQDPVLFAGTLRESLDPLGESDDASIWTALRRVRFMDSLQTTETAPTGSAEATADGTGQTSLSLDDPVSENGGNFSQGQRQLLCLARALLRKSRVVILDEATASVDNVTDSRIQETIRNELTDVSLLCIAHRLRTVIDFDRIMVLDRGEIIQYAHPYELIRTVGTFKGMCEESGEFDELLEMAKRNAVQKGLVV
ncbi:hypothetical protein BJ742DRAFT_766053 [Cladochytrium replicatum]|nr:hypothetical protein BJ742DRAFT_766053 [Cladochytrium replicatum]